MADLDDELLQAYRDALYRVNGELDFKVDQYSDQLQQLHAQHEAQHSHFITAFNPESKRLPAEENAARHARLGEKLKALGVKKMPAAGLDPEGEWPPEPGYLVLNMKDEDVVAFGREYQQNAVVRIGADGIARLVVIAPVKER